MATEFRDYELYKRLEELYSRLNETNTKLDDLNTKLGTTNSKLDALNDTLTVTNRRLTTLLQQDLILWRINQNGDVIYNDTFDGLELKWETDTYQGGSVAREYSGSYVYHGNASVKLTVPTTSGAFAAIKKRFPVPNNISGVGFEFAFATLCDEVVGIEVWIAYLDGSNMHTMPLSYTCNTKDGGIGYGANMVTFSPKVTHEYAVFNKVKFTVDFEAGQGKDLWFNDIAKDISGAGFQVVANNSQPHILFIFKWVVKDSPTQSWDCWLDDFILSINEPKVF